MIQNERQYKVTKAKLKDLEKELSKLLENRESATNTHPRLMRMQSAALEDRIQMMYREIAEYKDLKDGKVRITIDRLSELPIALIKARISSGMTQGELADKIGIKEQQIQRYEANHYQAVGFDRLLVIA
ncbi:helix-turn-helix transcriptional regulator [Chamaesiphon sp. OTE_8_metabat_110]|uniref:helix-turn-helix transcriptional regulator n=1 Tax=Chamaesiphon sp. OTE_8_metabat_110 TaxID=2964696 RepID=UPI00286A3754|nr:helix-turn-helix transcriptional regulator [Chamaesiphon sp. OTE_8_metabat_110]